MRRNLQMAVLSLSFLISLTFSQGILDAIPQCYKDCLAQAGDYTCNGLDIPCLCRLSNGNFITKLITCIKANCDNNLNVAELVGPAAQICAARGVPIDPEDIANAQSIGSSLALTATATRPFTGVTTLTSSYASAGTRYVVVIPLSASRGRTGGVQTITGPTRTILAASITGAGRGASESGGAEDRRSSGSSSATSTSTVTAVSTRTNTEITSSSSSASSTSTTTDINTRTTTAIVPASSSGGGAASANNQGGGGSGDDELGPRQGGDGTPFTSEGSLFPQSHHGWLGIGVCLVAILFAAL